LLKIDINKLYRDFSMNSKLHAFLKQCLLW